MFTVGLKCNFRRITARVSAGRHKQLVVSDMLLFICSWFKYWFIKPDLVSVGKFCFNFSLALGGIVDYVNIHPSTHVRLNHCWRDAQNMCALTKVGTVLNTCTTTLIKQPCFSGLMVVA